MRAEKRMVQTGLSVDALTEIKAGLSEDDEILVKGLSLVGDGQLIHAVIAAQ